MLKEIYLKCASLGIDTPQEVDDFFGGDDPTDKEGYEINLNPEYDDNEVYVDLEKLDKKIKAIKIYLSD